MKLSADLLKESAELFYFFVPSKHISIKTVDGLKEFFDNYGADYNLFSNLLEVDKVRFYYFFLNGYCVNLNLYFCVGEIFMANKKEMLNRVPVVFFAKESLLIDEFMTNLFEIFEEKRVCVPVAQLVGSLDELVKDCLLHFGLLQQVYLKEIAKELGVKKRPLPRKKIQNNTTK